MGFSLGSRVSYMAWESRSSCERRTHSDIGMSVSVSVSMCLYLHLYLFCVRVSVSKSGSVSCTRHK